MKKQYIILSVLFVLLALILGGIWCWEKGSQKEKNQSQEVTKNQDVNQMPMQNSEQDTLSDAEKKVQEQREAQEREIAALYKNADEKIKTGELVWYDIPELGIRFKVTPEVKGELVYAKDSDFSAVDLSTKTLESIKHCSAEEGHPLGGISRVYGYPKESMPPCVGGYKRKEFDGGYFCYSPAQSVCTWTDEDLKKYEEIWPTAKEYIELFTSESFWNNAQLTK